MVKAAKALSQVITHTAIAFGLTYSLTGSVALGGLAAIIEPVLNVALLPWHEKAWHALRHRWHERKIGLALVAAEKVSQTGMHMSVAFVVMYWATGSMAFGGLIAVLEPVCNVILLPVHDRWWDQMIARRAARNNALPI
ncbi:DUF2061 domain-containing protein [Janthinobacterium agaricidamnosum]|uniref:DUF2061 domain-containing protein n=1 Tax=Janthinobacterium agaricidamnosum NBRC 102515 = DSM 9628 TaxID=1349767 RepID=W0V300_9BURK|nr:DUF2061 domain-containing protein [Janthinobacterium agaricidamnosum]CDG83214.1 putative uncharacterized protein [Janthinobacterium agaricidamnosum NBRC 102515 = DSM 9628]